MVDTSSMCHPRLLYLSKAAKDLACLGSNLSPLSFLSLTKVIVLLSRPLSLGTLFSIRSFLGQGRPLILGKGWWWICWL